jgi:hypothetical protein
MSSFAFLVLVRLLGGDAAIVFCVYTVVTLAKISLMPWRWGSGRAAGPSLQPMLTTLVIGIAVLSGSSS